MVGGVAGVIMPDDRFMGAGESPTHSREGLQSSHAT